MLYYLALVIVPLFNGLGFGNLSFNPWFLNALKLDYFLLVPTFCFWIFAFGPKSWLRLIGLILTVPLSLLGLLGLAFSEFGDPAMGNLIYTLQHGGLTDSVMRTYTSDGTVPFAGKLGDKNVRIIEWSRGAFMSWRYRLAITRDVGPYFYETIFEEELGGHIFPRLETSPTGKLQLVVQNSLSKEFFRKDIESILAENNSMSLRSAMNAQR